MKTQWLCQNSVKIEEWLSKQEHQYELPLYSSVDVRDAGFKRAIVDTNLFPAGFNNLCALNISDAVIAFKETLLTRFPHCENVLIVCEEHTRNTWYLENVRALKHILKLAGFDPIVATFLDPSMTGSHHLDTATGEKLEVYSLKDLLDRYHNGAIKLDLLILNHDLTNGIPDLLKNLDLPMLPPPQAGWHYRLKSHHFDHTASIVTDFAAAMDTDPWLFSCLYNVCDQVNINEEDDRQKMADSASDLFKRIEQKYKEYNISEKPLIFMKSDYGTYGMGVRAIEDPADIIDLNRKGRNQLYKGKSSKVIERFLLQEGVPTINSVDNYPAEVCLYQISNRFVGGFYRYNDEKSGRENLNSRGMKFKSICVTASYLSEVARKTDCPDESAPSSTQAGPAGLVGYQVLARIAGLAAAREIQHLKVEASL